MATEAGIEALNVPTPRSSFDDVLRMLPCWAEIDLDAVEANVANLRRWLGPGTALAAVVKAQGYGTGACEVACAALEAGARWLAVARLHEGRELRESGIRAPILILTRTHPSRADEVVRLDLTATVENATLGQALGDAATRVGRRASIHVKVDTGLHRFGVQPQEALPLVRSLSEVDGLDIQAIYTHFASADETDLSFTREQLLCFLDVTRRVEGAGYRFPMRHAANSAGTLAVREAHLDLVRIGLALYGVSPSGEVPDGLHLRPSVSLRARVARVAEIAEGEGVGYGQTWLAKRATRVALVTAGYADGVSRRLSNTGAVLVNGNRCPIIGRVSMDQTTVDVTGCGPVKVGDVATFLGRDGNAEIDLHRFASDADTIPHDILTAIGARVPRAYIRDGRVSHIARLSGVTDVMGNGQRL
ncbi:MAG: alanine racemase [Chloroflexi bacterium]|nr:alanine racemase [Chloroflexota bacterium]